jgi:protein-S-isoprenylcysteine O-methyltransferase Ste14
MKPVIIIILLTFTIVLAWLTWWISLRGKRYHGIFRFISFECILILVLYNYPVWFNDPFSLHQIISWILLLLSLVVAASGFYTFYSKGKPRDRMEETTTLITTGLFKYIRHPLYLSLILGGFGILAKDYGYIQWILTILNFTALIITARVEEKEMKIKFGHEYSEYINKTKMFIPYIF